MREFSAGCAVKFSAALRAGEANACFTGGEADAENSTGRKAAAEN